MHDFKNILIGIDPAEIAQFPSGLPAVTRARLRWAFDLAKSNQSQLLFFSASPTVDDALWPLHPDHRSSMRVQTHQRISKALESLVYEARHEEIPSDCKLVDGDGWLEIIRQVRRGFHDLVIVGTRSYQGLQRLILGSTARKLVHFCPCPVLVAKPDTVNTASNLLVATDLTPFSTDLLRIGLSLAEAMKVHAHVLHVVQQELSDVCWIGLPDSVQEDRRHQIRNRAEALMKSQLDCVASYRLHQDRITTDVAESPDGPDVMIHQYITEHHIDLLIIGTVGRSGVEGLLVGNTAERLLSDVDCSVLAVKPPDFVCRVA